MGGRKQVIEFRESSCQLPSGGPYVLPPSLDNLFSRWAGIQSPHPVSGHPLERLSFPELSCQIHCLSLLESSRFCWVPSQVGAWGHNEKKKKNTGKNNSDWYTDIVVIPGRHKMDVTIMLNQVFGNFYIGTKWQYYFSFFLSIFFLGEERGR